MPALAALLVLFTTPVRASLTTVGAKGGGSGNEPSLILPGGILDTYYGLANLKRIDDFGPTTTDQLWQFLGASAAVKIDVRYAGDASAIGVSRADGSSPVDLFSASPGANPSVWINSSLGAGVISLDKGTQTITLYNHHSNPVYSPFAWIGHDTNAKNLWSSIQALNNGTGGYSNDPGYRDHFVTWLVTGGKYKGSYVVGFEDLSKAQGSDRDFNDLVFQITGVAPVPEPSTLAIAGMGLLGLAGYALRRRAC